MRSSTGVSGFVLGAAVVFCFFHPIQPEVSGSSSAHASDRATPKQRADAVEQSLIPLYFLEGERPTYANLLRRMTELHVPGVTIAAIHGGHVDWARGYGVAALNGPAVTPHTLFAAESMSKPVTALAVLKLYEERKIELDRNVNDYLKRWKLPENTLSGPKIVTVRQLLTHTSGIGTHNGELYDVSKPMPTLLNDLDGEPPSRTPAVRIETPPGSKYHYANGGYEVLQLLVEDVTGESFASFVTKAVLQPAEMTRSRYGVPLSDELSAQAATAYQVDHAIPPQKYFNSNYAAGGLWSTATDMARLLIEVQQEYCGKSSRILKQATIRQALVPGPTVKPGELWQGLGIMIGGKDGAHYMEHGGAGFFQDDMVAYFQNRRDGLVVMANGNAGGLVDEVLRGASTVYRWPDYQQKPHRFVPFDASAAEKFVGSFGPLKFDPSPGGFSVEMPAGAMPERMYADGAGHFFILGGPQEFTFSDEVNGQMQSLRFVTPMADIQWKRAAPEPIQK
jgi:CubicO group peptidase (beta-lactamase class C family)